MHIILTEIISTNVSYCIPGVWCQSFGQQFFFTYFKVDFPLLVYAPCPLLVQCCSARRFLSGLTVKTPHCVSCTVICGCVLSSHRIQLQVILVLGCVSSYGDLTFERWIVVSATTLVYVPHPLQFVSWKLPDPVPVITTGDGVASDSAGEGK